MVEQHSFIIPIATLQKKVEKHTSVLGMHRSAEGAPHLIEPFSFTKGESFLFDDYLPEAVAKTFSRIKAFSRNLPDGYRIYHGMTKREVHDFDDTHILYDGMVFDSNVAKIRVLPHMWEVEDVEGEEEQKRITIHLPHLLIHKGDANAVSFVLDVEYTTLADGTFEDRFTHQETIHSEEDVDIEEYSFSAPVFQDGFPTVVSDVIGITVMLLDDVAPALDLKKGELIDLVTKDGNHLYGIQQTNGTRLDVAQWYDEDISESVVFKVELPEWQDRNMLPVVQDHLENALMNYIIYRWFETVNPKEADVYNAKWEEKAHAAQLALNAERKILQRKSTWL